MAELGIEYVADGSNVDDLGDYRPGLQALKELDIKDVYKRQSQGRGNASH